MLFSLTNTHTGAKNYLIKEKYEVGRKNCDFLIENDLSISRKHAVIEIEENKVKVTDADSKYKSFLNGEQLKPNVACLLKHGDEIQFGVYNSKFRLEQQKLVTTATRLPGAEKIQLKNEMAIIHGLYVEDWSQDCTHLTVKEIALTVKVLYALIDDKPIVMPQYWTKLKRHVTLGEECPKIEDYNNPPVNETLLSRVEWKREINRRNMFKNKLFIFLTENSKKTMEGVISRLGGTSIAWEKNPMPSEDVEKSPKQIIVIQPIEKTQNNSFEELTKLVLAKGQRLIPQQEIALAVVAGSCQKDCNPEFDRASEVFCNVNRHTPSQSTVVAQNTESQTYSQDLSKVKEEETQMIIEATVSPQNNTNKPDKMSSSVDDNIEENKSEAFKRPSDMAITNVSKRMRTEDIEWTTSNFNRNESNEITRFNDDEANKNSSHTNAQKRKASHEIGEESSSTRNPFLSIGKKIKHERRQDENNPFMDLTRSSKDDVQPVLRRNPFFRPRPVPKVKEEEEDRKTANILSSTAYTSVLEQPSLEYSRISKLDENSNATWVSKKEAPSIVAVKEEYEDFIIEFRNQFKDKVVIDCTSKMVEKNKENMDRVDSSRNNGKVNFKIFKKVLPLHPQRTSINQTAMASVTLENATKAGAEPLQIFNDDDEDDNVNVRPVKRRVKKLVL